MLKFFTKRMNNKKGFTLIELIVVIAILGILAAIAIPRLSGSRQKAATAADEASIRTVESAISIALAEGDLIINDSKNGFVDKSNGTIASTAEGLGSILVPTYLKAMPTSQVNKGKAIKITWGSDNYTLGWAD